MRLNGGVGMLNFEISRCRLRSADGRPTPVLVVLFGLGLTGEAVAMPLPPFFPHWRMSGDVEIVECQDAALLSLLSLFTQGPIVVIRCTVSPKGVSDSHESLRCAVVIVDIMDMWSDVIKILWPRQIHRRWSENSMLTLRRRILTDQFRLVPSEKSVWFLSAH